MRADVAEPSVEFREVGIALEGNPVLREVALTVPRAPARRTRTA